MAYAIQARGLSKEYRIGQYSANYDTLREHLVRLGQSLVGREPTGESETMIWALRDVDFDVRQGEVVGIVGRNGAGKTTLLRLLSRITEPTAGYADVRGRLGSLLEVGAGFHPELTGRENIYLNGAVLGMTRSEIARKFDDIVEFAGVEKFVETPVKRYSSGMYVRLAFSVAAHLEPEILVVDEVLAVGDVEFQKRSLGKLDEVGRLGRTVLFVSHNMETISRLCSRALLLEKGRLVLDAPAEQVVAAYLREEFGSPAAQHWDGDESPGNEYVRLRSVRVIDAEGRDAGNVDVRSQVGIETTFEILMRGPSFVPWLALFDERRGHIFSAMDIHPVWLEARDPGLYTVVAWIPPNLLNEGLILVDMSLNTFSSGGQAIMQAAALKAVSFNVYDNAEGDTARGRYPGIWRAPVRPLLQWDTHTDLVSHAVSSAPPAR